MRTANLEKLPLTMRNIATKNESRDVGFYFASSTRICSDGEDNDGNDRSMVVKKQKTCVTARYGPLDSSVLDAQDKDYGRLGGFQNDNKLTCFAHPVS
ncbi:hypothetical protein V6N12_054019 [Hibiscus sabdariffa]|uniref:Uncharacterized protein n=1 Tax=Hibiscus sabdariffa TaxID=183260 RepID=A0ABR2D9A2_9ROSI